MKVWILVKRKTLKSMFPVVVVHRYRQKQKSNKFAHLSISERLNRITHSHGSTEAFYFHRCVTFDYHFIDFSFLPLPDIIVICLAAIDFMGVGRGGACWLERSDVMYAWPSRATAHTHGAGRCCGQRPDRPVSATSRPRQACLTPRWRGRNPNELTFVT